MDHGPVVQILMAIRWPLLLVCPNFFYPSNAFSVSWQCVSCYLPDGSNIIPSELSRGVRNPMKMSDIGFLKTELTSKFKNWKLDQQSKYFSSCHVSALLVLSHFGSQIVGPIQHGSMSFLASYRRGVNERWRPRRQTNVGLTEPKKLKPRLI